MESAHRLFILAVQRNFVQGRKTFVVIAACLYIVCRREKSDHLLIDFSDSLQVCVHVIECAYACVYVHVYVCMCMCMCMGMCMCMCMCVYVYVHMYMFVQACVNY